MNKIDILEFSIDQKSKDKKKNELVFKPVEQESISDLGSSIEEVNIDFSDFSH